VKSKAMRWLGGLALLGGTAFYVYFLHRSVQVKDLGGWHSEFSYQPFHCPVCHGRVEQLTYQGKPVAPPSRRWDDQPGIQSSQILTPVGEFTAFKDWKSWGMTHGPMFVEDATDAVSSPELKQGWYDARKPGEPPCEIGPFLRKANTPGHWCLLVTDDAARWMSPERIGDLAW